jgi:Tol biopolymer transport system component
LTFQGTYNRTPVWSPDGKRIAVISNKDAAQNTYWLMADGSGEMQRLNTSTDITSPTSFSPDGRLLALNQVDPVTQRDIWLVQLSDLKTWPFLRTPVNETSARFSPDGHWIAYASDESGRWEIYVQPYPGPGGKWQISTDGGTEPVWNLKGRELFYRSEDKMMAVDISTRPAFSAGKPRMLFAGDYFFAPGSDSAPEYDVSPDGQRFLMLKDSGGSTAAQSQIVVVQNWAAELKRGLAPVQK